MSLLLCNHHISVVEVGEIEFVKNVGMDGQRNPGSLRRFLLLYRLRETKRLRSQGVDREVFYSEKGVVLLLEYFWR